MITSKEIPRLFCTEMIQALNRRNNPKTMTRRLDGLGEINKNPDDWEFKGIAPNKKLFVFYNGKKRILLIKCPYGVGHIICPKETWAVDKAFDKNSPISKRMLLHKPTVEYKADNNNLLANRGKWRSGMFQPKWAWRNKQVITRVRVERLHDITGKDCIKEGYPVKDNLYIEYGKYKKAREWFKALWESINGNWEINPFVFVIEFRKI